MSSKYPFEAGIRATLPMTMIMYGAKLLRFPPVDIFRILGGLFTRKTAPALFIGAVAHFIIGGISAWVYSLAWWLGMGKATYLWGTVFGTMHGVIAHFTMDNLLPRHPRQPHPYQPKTAIVYVIAHTIFGFFVARFIHSARHD